MEPIAMFLYGMAFGMLLGFAFAIALDEIRLKRIVREQIRLEKLQRETKKGAGE